MEYAVLNSIAVARILIYITPTEFFLTLEISHEEDATGFYVD